MTDRQTETEYACSRYFKLVGVCGGCFPSCKHSKCDVMFATLFTCIIIFMLSPLCIKPDTFGESTLVLLSFMMQKVFQSILVKHVISLSLIINVS